MDYETDDTFDVQKKTPRKSSGGGVGASKKTPAKSGEATQPVADGETIDKTPQESDGKISEETPKKAVRAKKTLTKKTPSKKTPAKKTPAKKTPAKKTPTTDGGLPIGEGGVVDAVQQENGVPKPKRKRKQPAQEVDPAAEPPCKDAQGDPPIEPEEETEPGGRRRRGAAKA